MRLKSVFLMALLAFSSIAQTLPKRQMEGLDRGLVAVKIAGAVFVSWRVLGNEKETAFNVYRDGTLIKEVSNTQATSFLDTSGTVTSKYVVKAVVDGVEEEQGSKEVTPWAQQTDGPYMTIQLDLPEGGKTPPNVEHNGTSGGTAINYPDGQDYTYTPNDCSVADLDGDGEYEIIVKWDPSNSKDNSQTGITGNVYIDAYKLDGTKLWRVDLGRNIRAGAHYTQFLVYDFDGDGKAELVCKTAPGTIDGKENFVLLGSDKSDADYRNLNLSTSGSNRCGFVLSGPEYLTLFDGATGENLHTIPFSPARGSVGSWGDNYGNRVDRFLACVAYLDGIHPSAVMCRGYYNRAALTAYDVAGKKLVERWAYDSSASSSVSGGSIAGQGNHNLSVADVDSDGKDEIIYGSSAIDDNGKRLYSTGLGHGDAMHLSDLDPDRPGLEVFEVHEEKSSFNHEVHDAATGEIIWHSTAFDSDNGRGMSGDIDPRHKGLEVWSSSEGGVYNCKGVQVSSRKPSTNFRIYWDGDLQDELFDGQSNPTIRKWNTSTNRETELLKLSGTSTCNTTKATPCISADILGDWREEVITRVSNDPSKLRIYTTKTTTNHRMYTLMHDPVYRLAIAWQNAAYNQPPHLGIYIGDGVDGDKIPWPNFYTSKDTIPSSMPSVNMDDVAVRTLIDQNEILKIYSDVNMKNVQVYSAYGTLIYSSQFSGTYTVEVPLSGIQNQVLIVKVSTDTGVETVKMFKK